MAINKETRYGFMPGCSLSSYNPEAVIKTVAYLSEVFPKFSAVLKCCGKPTRDVGQQELFRERFEGLLADMQDVEIEEMIFACPNCKAVFEKESQVKCHSLWEIFPLVGLPGEARGKAKESDMVFTIHDSCAARGDGAAQEGIRWILSELGYRFVESEYSREKTRCCGYGGMVGPVNPELARKVMQRRVETLAEYPVVTYCATCRSALVRAGRDAWHVLDLIWGPVVHVGDGPPENVLDVPEHVWHNRFKTRRGILEQG
jgi:Fe-S oxidoreductase